MPRNKNIFVSLLLGMLLMLSFDAAWGQGMRPRAARSADEMTIKRAESLARLGKTSQAVDLYLDVLYRNPKQTNLYYKIAELLPGKENAARLLTILDDVQQRSSQNHNFTAEKGRLLYSLERSEDALEVWHQMIQDREERFIYSVVTNSMIRAGAIDEAVNTLKTARVTLNEPYAFTMELARIYAIQHDYLNASFEYLKHLDRSPNTLHHVSNQLISMVQNDGALIHIEQSFNAVLGQEGSHQAVYLAQAKVYQYLKQYDACLVSINSLDQKESVQEILSIAKDLREEEAWNHAAELFLIVSTASPENRIRGEALLHLASVYEQQLGERKTFESLASYYGGNPFFELDIKLAGEQDEKLERTFELYDSLQTALPRSISAMEARYRIADLRLTTSGDVDRAIRGFQEVLDQASLPGLKLKAGKRLVDAWLVKGDYSQANHVLDTIIERLNLDEDDPDIISSRIRILMHRADMSALKKELLNLSGSAMPGDKRFNDALEMLSLIEGNGGEENKSLQVYFEAERLIGQHKLTQAYQRLSEFDGANSSIADEARIRSIQLMLVLGKWSEAKRAIDEFLEAFPSSPWRPTALVWMAEQLHFREADPMSAVPFYETVIINHPEFLGIQDVRIRLRAIIGSGS